MGNPQGPGRVEQDAGQSIGAAEQTKSGRPGKAASSATPGHVLVVVPRRYGRVEVQAPDGSLADCAGGQVALMPRSQAEAIGAEPAPKGAKAGEGVPERPSPAPAAMVDQAQDEARRDLEA